MISPASASDVLSVNYPFFLIPSSLFILQEISDFLLYLYYTFFLLWLDFDQTGYDQIIYVKVVTYHESHLLYLPEKSENVSLWRSTWLLLFTTPCWPLSAGWLWRDSTSTFTLSKSFTSMSADTSSNSAWWNGVESSTPNRKFSLSDYRLYQADQWKCNVRNEFASM